MVVTHMHAICGYWDDLTSVGKGMKLEKVSAGKAQVHNKRHW